jgi:flagellar basal body-associated protein FliL
MVSLAIIVVLAIVGMIAFPAAIWAFFWWNSFKHKVWIAKQSGKDESDVIWVEDKCKVVDINGEHQIKFRGHKGGSPSFPGGFWTKVFPKKLPHSMSEKQWYEMKKSLGRGIFLYQTTEGEFHPMRIQTDNEGFKSFRVLTQDNRGFIIRSLSDNNELAFNGRKQMITYIAIAGVFIILAICFIIWLVYLTESASNVCNVASSSFTETAQGVIGA